MQTSQYEAIPAIPASPSHPVWDEKNNEISIDTSIATLDGKNYGKVMVEIGFYKGKFGNRELIGEKKLYGLKMEEGVVDINFTTKLPEKPDSFSYTLYVMDNRIF